MWRRERPAGRPSRLRAYGASGAAAGRACYESSMKDDTVAAVLEKLGVERPAPDLDGLRAVYAAWCGAVAFDNVLKLIHLADERSGPLPGSTAESFFEAWLEHGTGGTCWSGNGALHDLLDALGFDVARAIATMLSSPEAREPNHGSVIATVEGERWIVDASILSGEPIRIPDAGEPAGDGPLPRFEWLDSPPCRRLAYGDRPRGLPVPDRADRGRRDRMGRAPPAHERLEPVQLPAQREGAAEWNERRRRPGRALHGGSGRLGLVARARRGRTGPVSRRGARHLRGDRPPGARRPAAAAAPLIRSVSFLGRRLSRP